MISHENIRGDGIIKKVYFISQMLVDWLFGEEGITYKNIKYFIRIFMK